MKRKWRVGEVVCRCGAYRFPHRQLGGLCKGGAFVDDTFQREMYGACKDCHFRIEEDYVVKCQVVEGLDETIYCPELQAHIQYNEIRLYGENANPEIENPKRRRRKRR